MPSVMKSMKKELGLAEYPSNLNGTKLNCTPSLYRWDSRTMRAQLATVFKILDFPEAFGPNRP